MSKIKVLIVDDSAVVRMSVSQALSVDPEIFLLPPAVDPIDAMARMEKIYPDVIILDIEMPKMDGLSFLKKIMGERPTPVIIMSTLVAKGAASAIQAIEYGAVATVEKPKAGLVRFFHDGASDLVGLVKQAARANVLNLRLPDLGRPGPLSYAGSASSKIIAIGASMGGTKAIEAVLKTMPVNCPPIVITQHMPAVFTNHFANRLHSVSPIDVKEAEDGDICRPGLALISPGGRHTMLRKNASGDYCVNVVDGPLVNRHKPSVNVLFRSFAKTAGKNAVAAILTGLGDDGAQGLLEVKEAGGQTIAESEETCVVFGMPREAIKLGGACKVLPLGDVPLELLNLCKK